MSGFNDTRTLAELLLAPKRPLSRSVPSLSGLKVSLGGLPLPGVITDAAQLAGPVRNNLAAALKAKQALVALSTSVNKVLAGFDTQRRLLTSGNFVPLDPLVAVATKGVPTVASFFSFSSLKPGQPIPAAFTAIIDQRKQQLQQLAKSLSAVFKGTPFSAGVTVTENTSPVPYPVPEDVDLPDTPRLAQGGKAAQADPIIKDKRRFAVQGNVIGAGVPSFWSRLLSAAHISAVPTLNTTVGQIFKDRKKAGTWSEPVTPYAAQHPYNKVQQTESGHAIELDDTPGAERVHVFHRAGSFIEFHPDGSVVYKNMKHSYMVTLADSHVKVGGSCHVAIDGNSTLYVKGNVDMQTDGDFNVQAKGDFNVYAANVNLRAKTKFKADGTIIDLRYMTLPFGIMPVSYGLAPIGFTPKINMTAIAADTGFLPSFPIPSANALLAVAPTTAITQMLPDVPPANPLSNFSVYTKTAPEAVAYRAKFFDTPEEVQDAELYAGHASLQSALGDVSPTARQLGGSLSTLDTGIVEPVNKVSVNYLNFEDYRGTYSYANTFALGGTSFTLADVADLALHPDVVADSLNGDMVEDVPDDTSTVPSNNPTPPIETP